MCRAASCHRPGLLLAFLLNFLQRLAIVLVPAFVYVGTGGVPGRVSEVIVTQSLVIVGSNAIPVPGAVGVADYLFLDGFEAIVPEPVNLELLSRGISFYLLHRPVRPGAAVQRAGALDSRAAGRPGAGISPKAQKTAGRSCIRPAVFYAVYCSPIIMETF